MKTYKWSALALLVSVLLLTGCVPPFGPELADTLAAPDFVGVPSESAQPLPFPQGQTAEAANTINHGKFSLSLKNVDIKEAVAILSKESPIPIIAESGVSGRVTVNIKDKPLGDLLFTMLRPLGYVAKIEDGMIVVGPAGMITRTFVVNYLKDKRTSNSVTQASISAGSSGSDGGSSSGGSQGNVSVTTSGGSDFWGEIIKGVESLAYGSDKNASGSAGINIVTNQLAGIIHVTAPSQTMTIISDYLASIDQEIKRQVLIQAHIVEVELNDEFSLGIDWTNVFNSLKGSISFGTIPNTIGTPNSFVFNLDTNNFDLLLDTFKEQGGLNMLSSPKISTLNNQKAVIKLTTNEVTWVQSVLRDSDGNITETINTPQIDEVGLFLDVTPNIAASGSISMQVHPSITEVKEISESPDGNSSKPVITVREVDAMVDVQSGQTMVIGGLIADKITNLKRGIPILGDIPYLGWLFANHSQVKRKTELVIFLTPYVLNGATIESIRTEHEKRLWGNEGINQYVHKIME